MCVRSRKKKQRNKKQRTKKKKLMWRKCLSKNAGCPKQHSHIKGSSELLAQNLHFCSLCFLSFSLFRVALRLVREGSSVERSGEGEGTGVERYGGRWRQTRWTKMSGCMK
ncbi:hypothetical protein GmHk_03G007447 [Glycine max]|nr:hypothetical protein GmHk_03G007447 [Glycine max]